VGWGICDQKLNTAKSTCPSIWGRAEKTYQTHQGPRLWWIDPPTDSEIQTLVVTLATRVVRFLKKKGYFQDDIDSALPSEDMIQEELLPELQAASVQSRIALGDRRGQRVRRLGALESADFQPELKGPLCAVSAGFSLHAAVYCAPWERDKLEKLCRYITRPATENSSHEIFRLPCTSCQDSLSDRAQERANPRGV
jgi:hypothetical protein